MLYADLMCFMHTASEAQLLAGSSNFPLWSNFKLRKENQKKKKQDQVVRKEEIHLSGEKSSCVIHSHTDERKEKSSP